MDKKLIFILVLLAIIAIALIYYLKKNSESWKLQANLNLAFANKLGIPIVDVDSEVVEDKPETPEPESEETTSEPEQETTTEPEVNEEEGSPEPEVTPDPETTSEQQTETEVTSEPETTEPEVSTGPEATILTVVPPDPETIPEPVVEPPAETKTGGSKKGGGKNKMNENSERKVNTRVKKKTEEEEEALVNPVPLRERVGDKKMDNGKKETLEKINKLKTLEKNIRENTDLFDGGNGSGE